MSALDHIGPPGPSCDCEGARKEREAERDESIAYEKRYRGAGKKRWRLTLDITCFDSNEAFTAALHDVVNIFHFGEQPKHGLAFGISDSIAGHSARIRIEGK